MNSPPSSGGMYTLKVNIGTVQPNVPSSSINNTNENNINSPNNESMYYRQEMAITLGDLIDVLEAMNVEFQKFQQQSLKVVFQFNNGLLSIILRLKNNHARAQSPSPHQIENSPLKSNIPLASRFEEITIPPNDIPHKNPIVLLGSKVKEEIPLPSGSQELPPLGMAIKHNIYAQGGMNTSALTAKQLGITDNMPVTDIICLMQQYDLNNHTNDNQPTSLGNIYPALEQAWGKPGGAWESLGTPGSLRAL